jgi:hypothetical protein
MLTDILSMYDDGYVEEVDLRKYMYLERTSGIANFIGGVIFGILLPILFWVAVHFELLKPSLPDFTPAVTSPTDVGTSVQTALVTFCILVGFVITTWLLFFVLFLLPVIKNRGGGWHTAGLLAYCLGPVIFPLAAALML